MKLIALIKTFFLMNSRKGYDPYDCIKRFGYVPKAHKPK